MAGKFEVYEDRAGKFRFRLKAANGQVVATGEAYETKSPPRRVRGRQNAASGASVVRSSSPPKVLRRWPPLQPDGGAAVALPGSAQRPDRPSRTQGRPVSRRTPRPWSRDNGEPADQRASIAAGLGVDRKRRFGHDSHSVVVG